MKNKLLLTHRKRSHDFNHKSLILRLLYIRHFVLASTGLHLLTSYLLPFHLLHLFTSCHIHVTKSNQTLNFTAECQPGVVAHACNPATWRLGCLNGLRSGSLGRLSYVDRVSTLSSASIWGTWRNLRSPGRLKRSESAQGGNTAGKSFRVKQ